VIAVGWAL